MYPIIHIFGTICLFLKLQFIMPNRNILRKGLIQVRNILQKQEI